MVTGVSSTDQTAYLSIINNAQKTGAQSATSSASTKNGNDIKDSYVPSFDFNGTGSEFYTEHCNDTDMWMTKFSTSLEGFTNGLKKQAIQDYNKQYPENKAIYLAGDNNSLTVYSLRDNGMLGGKDIGATNSLKSYLDSIDYKKEYEEYKQSRGCSSDDELKALKSTPLFQTKEQLVDWAKYSGLTSPNLKTDLSNCGVNSTNSTPWGLFSNEESNKILGATNLQDIADYWNSNNLAQNFKEQVSAFQSFMDKASSSEGLDDSLKGKITGLSKQITDSSDIIAKFSQKREEEIAARHNITQYNASLIANYAN